MRIHKYLKNNYKTKRNSIDFMRFFLFVFMLDNHKSIRKRILWPCKSKNQNKRTQKSKF